MSAERKLLAEIPVQRRVRIPKRAALEAAARFHAWQLAEQRLNDYLAGLALAKGLKPEDVQGVDDVTNQLILRTE